MSSSMCHPSDLCHTVSLRLKVHFHRHESVKSWQDISVLNKTTSHLLPLQHESDAVDVRDIDPFCFEHVLKHSQPVPDLVDGLVETGQKVGRNQMRFWGTYFPEKFNR